MLKTKRQLSKEVAKKTGFLMAPVSEVLSALEESMHSSLLNGDTVRLGPIEFGTKTYPEQYGVNPKSGEPYHSPAHIVPYAKIREGTKKGYKLRKKAQKENLDG